MSKKPVLRVRKSGALLVAALLACVLGLALVVSVLHAYYRDVAPILGAVLLDRLKHRGWRLK